MRNLPILFFAVLFLTAASHPNFSGSWKMDPTKSDFGPLPRPSTYERKIDHRDPIIRMNVHQASNMGERTVDINLRTDGQATTNTSPTGLARSTAKWTGQELDLTTTRTMQGGDVVTRETWDLSPDGKILTSITHMKTPTGNFEIKMVLNKQQ